MKLVFSFLFLFCLISQDECAVSFKPLGVYDYRLNISYSELKNFSKNLTYESKSKFDSNVSIYSLFENQKILGHTRKVRYYFAFKKGRLVAYVFNIYSGKDIKHFKAFVEEAKEYNDFISGKGTSFLDEDKRCEKFLRLKSGPKEIIIFGGISQIGSTW